MIFALIAAIGAMASVILSRKRTQPSQSHNLFSKNVWRVVNANLEQRKIIQGFYSLRSNVLHSAILTHAEPVVEPPPGFEPGVFSLQG